MQDQNRNRGTGPLPRAGYAAVIDGLRSQPTTRGLSSDALRLVMGFRILAICNRLKHDPVLELIQRFASIEAAKAFIAFADVLGGTWPDPVQVMRPCCRMLSPDEVTIAAMADAAKSGNRVRFGRDLAGFVSANKADKLFDCAARTVAAFY